MGYLFSHYLPQFSDLNVLHYFQVYHVAGRVNMVIRDPEKMVGFNKCIIYKITLTFIHLLSTKYFWATTNK